MAPSKSGSSHTRMTPNASDRGARWRRSCTHVTTRSWTNRCRNGSKTRVQLFIHTEQGAANSQCQDATGDQVCRWEFPEVNDYKSAGCIKMSPDDLAELSRHFLRFYRAGVRYSKARVIVRVVA